MAQVVSAAWIRSGLSLRRDTEAPILKFNTNDWLRTHQDEAAHPQAEPIIESILIPKTQDSRQALSHFSACTIRS